MCSSVMNAVIKLLLSPRNKINWLKVVTDVLAQALGFSGVNVCLGIPPLGSNFCWA